MSNKQFVVVIVITFIVVVFWIIADILHTRPSVAVNPKLQTLLTPISPNFDQKVLTQIKDEVKSVDEINPAFQPPATPTPTPVPSQIPLPPPLPATPGGALP